MNKKKFLITFIFTIFCFVSAFSQGDWIMVYENDEATVYINKVIPQTDHSYFALEKWVFKKPQKTGKELPAKYYQETIYLHEYKNDFSMKGILSYTHYNSNGKVVESDSWKFVAWLFVEPGTIDEAIAKGIQYIINNY